jgi:hypothetical protein
MVQPTANCSEFTVFDVKHDRVVVNAIGDHGENRIPQGPNILDRG